jgi:hypothetical protein
MAPIVGSASITFATTATLTFEPVDIFSTSSLGLSFGGGLLTSSGGVRRNPNAAGASSRRRNPSSAGRPSAAS